MPFSIRWFLLDWIHHALRHLSAAGAERSPASAAERRRRLSQLQPSEAGRSLIMHWKALPQSAAHFSYPILVAVTGGQVADSACRERTGRGRSAKKPTRGAVTGGPSMNPSTTVGTLRGSLGISAWRSIAHRTVNESGSLFIECWFKKR